MAKGFKELDANPEARALEHAEWLGLLLEHEVTLRRQKRFETRARAARLRHPASVEDVDYRAARGLDRALFLKLAACDWIRDPAQPADHRAVRRRQELARLRARPQGLPGGSLRPLLTACPGCSPRSRSRAATAATPSCCAQLARVDLLILDDWGPEPLTAEQRRDLLEIVEDRYDAGSIHRSPASCRSTAGTRSSAIPTLADAILDRLVHNAYRIELAGESLRKRQAPEPAT